MLRTEGLGHFSRPYVRKMPGSASNFIPLFVSLSRSFYSTDKWYLFEKVEDGCTQQAITLSQKNQYYTVFSSRIPFKIALR